MAAKKFLRNVAGILTEIFGVQSSAGVGNAGDIVALDDTGRIDDSMMPVGFGSESIVLPADEALAAGDFVNIFNDAGTTKVRLADASGGVAKKADGFVLDNVAEAADATVYYGNLNNEKTGLTKATRQYLSGLVPGGTTETAPTTTAHIVQPLGKSTIATEMIVDIEEPIVIA
jgi:hypothetical protein